MRNLVLILVLVLVLLCVEGMGWGLEDGGGFVLVYTSLWGSSVHRGPVLDVKDVVDSILMYTRLRVYYFTTALFCISKDVVDSVR